MGNDSPWGGLASGFAGGLEIGSNIMLRKQQYDVLDRENKAIKEFGLLAQKKQAERSTQEWVNERDTKLNELFKNDPNYKPIEIKKLPDTGVSIDEQIALHSKYGNFDQVTKLQEEKRKIENDKAQKELQSWQKGINTIDMIHKMAEPYKKDPAAYQTAIQTALSDDVISKMPQEVQGVMKAYKNAPMPMQADFGKIVGSVAKKIQTGDTKDIWVDMANLSAFNKLHDAGLDEVIKELYKKMGIQEQKEETQSVISLLQGTPTRVIGTPQDLSTMNNPNSLLYGGSGMADSQRGLIPPTQNELLRASMNVPPQGIVGKTLDRMINPKEVTQRWTERLKEVNGKTYWFPYDQSTGDWGEKPNRIATEKDLKNPTPPTPNYIPLQTENGYVPFNTKTGKVGAPTGETKPLTAKDELTKTITDKIKSPQGGTPPRKEGETWVGSDGLKHRINQGKEQIWRGN